jgi:hypothetical protein
MVGSLFQQPDGGHMREFSLIGFHVEDLNGRYLGVIECENKDKGTFHVTNLETNTHLTFKSTDLFLLERDVAWLLTAQV